MRTTHFRLTASQPTLCGAETGDVTAAPRLTTCDGCQRALAKAVAAIAARDTEATRRLLATCKAMMGREV